MLTFNFTGASTSFVVPSGVGSYNATLVQGGSGGNTRFDLTVVPGGLGGLVTGTFPATPGDTLTVTVGGKGGDGKFGLAGTGTFGDGTGGNGMGTGPFNFSGGGGGGASSVRSAENGLLLVGGGGGGAGINTNSGNDPEPGGNGGSPGQNGQADDPTENPGTGGTNTTPGVNGADTAGNGGNAIGDAPNGGGGGGHFGDGGAFGGFGAGGGGGANFISPQVTNVTQGTAALPGDGIIVLVPVPLVPLSLTTQIVPPTITLGTNQPFQDTATLAGGITPTGTITFELFAPNNPIPIQTSTVPVLGSGTFASPPFLPTQAGTYSYRVSYSGDASNNPITGVIETIIVVKNPVSLCVNAEVFPGKCHSAKTSVRATLRKGINPTGTLTFTLFRDYQLIEQQIQPVLHNGTFESSSVRIQEKGRYRWQALYSGDAQNAPQSAFSKWFHTYS